MTRAQHRYLAHVRDWHDGVLDGRAEAELQTGLCAAAFDAVACSCVRRGWMTRDNRLTDAGYAALAGIKTTEGGIDG